MKNKRPFSAGINIGSVSVVMIFSVLALTVFAVLTLITSQNEKKLAIKSADAVLRYYAADNVCVEKLAGIRALAENSGNDLKKIAASLPEGVSGAQKNGVLYLSYGENIDKNRTLSVLVAVDGGEVDVLRWEIVDTGDWNPDDGLNFQTIKY
jgi:hypothetical protein